MFSPGSRYENAGTYQVTKPDGTTITVTKTPTALRNQPRGFHRRLEGQRLDLIASYYLGDPTTFWRLCDANAAMVPDALAAHGLIGIPTKDRQP